MATEITGKTAFAANVKHLWGILRAQEMILFVSMIESERRTADGGTLLFSFMTPDTGPSLKLSDTKSL